MDKAEIRQKIREQIQKTEQTIEEYREMSKPVAPDAAIGRISRMDAINNKSVTEAALRQAERKLLQLERAFNEVDAPHFGKCKKCGEEIPLGRILIKPESTFCVKCAETT
jgi:DnaK suppressor protein